MEVHFHFIKENFSLIGKLVSSSGFEDAVFQAKLRKKGNLNGVFQAHITTVDEQFIQRSQKHWNGYFLSAF